MNSSSYLVSEKSKKLPGITITPGSDDTIIADLDHPVVQIMVQSPTEPPSGDFSETPPESEPQSVDHNSTIISVAEDIEHVQDVQIEQHDLQTDQNATIIEIEQKSDQIEPSSPNPREHLDESREIPPESER